ncbi:ABC transporter permease [Rhizobium sp. Leaf383]|uniref:ABC transporter permease n=1 Tax=Rhizobium sp. Leaf383 TaxID=1736357 RepID=UPI00071329F7|nr:ABC transporter permease [Rhizobium sp. Leaf383]KQS76416.1 peptide ABC transporter permease [Rhizobium sp. Leaf383]
MAGHLFGRVAKLLAVIFAISFLFFCLATQVGSDAARVAAGPMAPTSTVEAVRDRLGLDDPLHTRYLRFLAGILEGDLGVSLRTRQPISTDIVSFLPATAELVVTALGIGIAIALIMAYAQLLFPHSTLLKIAIMVGGSAPVYLTALLVIHVFWFHFGILPGFGRSAFSDTSQPSGYGVIGAISKGDLDQFADAVAHLVLPATTLALPLGLAVGRTLSSTLSNVMRQPFITFARGKGLAEHSLLVRHGLRNAATAPLAMLGLQLRLLYANLLVTERIFGWPGLGSYAIEAYAFSDLPVVLAVSLVFACFYIVVNSGLEIAQRSADPRITA